MLKEFYYTVLSYIVSINFIHFIEKKDTNTDNIELNNHTIIYTCRD